MSFILGKNNATVLRGKTKSFSHIASSVGVAVVLSIIDSLLSLAFPHILALLFAVTAFIGIAFAVSVLVSTFQNQICDFKRQIGALESDLYDARDKERRLVDELADLNDLMEQISIHFSDLFRKIPAPCFCFDENGNFKEWNRAFENLTLVDPSRIINSSLTTLIQIDGDPGKINALVASVFEGETFEGIEIETAFSGGGFKTILCNAFPLRGEGGKVTAAICAGIDITERIRLERRMLKHVEDLSEAQLKLEEKHNELEEVNAKLETLAMSDSLTGLKNHRAMQERLIAEYRRAVRHGSVVSLLLIDVDRFKKYNDSYGHLAGDAVLREVAEAITACMRETDFVARYGGEEFIAVLPHTDYLGSLEAAERLRHAVEQASWELIRVTVSIGVATLTTNMLHHSDLIAKADVALYYCKQHGRNQVVHSQDLPDEVSTPMRDAFTASLDFDEPSSFAA